MIRQKIFFDPKNFSNIQEATNIKLKWYVNNNDRVHVGTPIVRIILEGYDQPQVHVINYCCPINSISYFWLCNSF